MSSRALSVAAGSIGLGAVGYFFLSTFKTPGVTNIENRFTAAGGAPDHTPSHASKMGDQDDVAPRHGVKEQGVSSKQFKDNIDAQKPEPTELGKKWNRTQHNNDQGTRS